MYRRNGMERLGVLSSSQAGYDVIDVVELCAGQGLEFPWADLLTVIRAGEKSVSQLNSMFESDARTRGHPPSYSIADSDVLAPLDPPAGNVLAIGRNYAEHAGEIARIHGHEPSARPTVFTKAQTSINAPFGSIIVDPRVSIEIDWEAELGVVIGKPALNVAPEDALDHVFGYTVVNDVSARDIQFGWGGQFFMGKSLDGYCPVGPWIVTADEVADPQNLEIMLRVNGEIKQRASTSDMIFPVAELVSQLSTGMTLPAGTLIATGTPAGVGVAREPKEFLKPGDLMETEIAGIGTLRNRVVGPAAGS